MNDPSVKGEMVRQVQPDVVRGRPARLIAARLIVVAAILLSLTQALGASVTPVAPAAQSAAGPNAVQGLPWTPPEHAYRMHVTEDGMYRLDYAALAAAGLPVDSLDPTTFQVSTAGNEIAIQVTGDGDSQFEAGEAVIFYGRSLDSLFYDGLVPTNKYTGTNIYWLSYGGAPGLRMAEKDGSAGGDTPGPFPRRLHLEQNAQYQSSFPKELDADHWYDFMLQAVGTNAVRNKDYTFDAPNAISPAPDGLIQAALLGNYAGAHSLRIYVNGTQIFEQANLWSDFDAVVAQAAAPSTLFQTGSNSVRVQLVNIGKNIDRVYPNWLEVTYYGDYVADGDALAFRSPAAGAWRYQVRNFSNTAIEVYDVTDPAAVQRFSNTTVDGAAAPYQVSFGDAASDTSQYMAVATGGWRMPAEIEPAVALTSPYTLPDLRDTSFRADYIVISHSDFWPEALKLAHYRAREFNVALVDVQRIYDQFNGGLMSAEAIHDFLAYAYTSWPQPAPAYVVLIGDGTSDPRDYLGGGAPVFIPPYLYLADPTLGETAAENRFVTLVGNDILPDMHIGRLPVNTQAEAEAMVNKIIDYETQCSCGGWSYNTVFVADNFYDGGGDFYWYSDEIADGFADPPANTTPLIPKPPYQVEKLYLVDPIASGGTCNQDPEASPPVTECTDSLISTLNQEGALFVNYIGHAEKSAWAAEKLLTLDVLPRLDNAPCLPIMLPMTCFEGSFHEPGATSVSLSEGITRMAVDGAVASYAPTGFGLVTGHDILERGLLIALLHDNVDRLGAAITYSKHYLLDVAPQDLDLVDTFMLIGDPALKPKTDYVCSQIPTGVFIGNFRAAQADEGVRLSWLTASEVDMVGFNLLRSEDAGEFSQVNKELLPAQKAGSQNGDSYAYTDPDVNAGKTYYYKLQVIKLDGTTQEFGPAQAAAPAGKRQYLPLLGRP